MKIRKVRKKDLNEYINIKKESLKEYSKIVGKKINLTDSQIKKELYELLSSQKKFLLFIEEDKKIAGYLVGSLIISDHQNFGYIDDLFVRTQFRRKRFASRLVKEFIKIIKRKKAKKVRLGVNIHNKNATRLYEKLGFKIVHYEMDKELK